MKRNKKLKLALEKNYKKHKQHLYLHGRFIEQSGQFYEQEICTMINYQPEIKKQLEHIAKVSNKSFEEVAESAKKVGLYKEDWHGEYLFQIRTFFC